MRNKNNRDFKRVFNLNTILSQLINWVAYIIFIISLGIIFYLSFVQSFEIVTDWRSLTIYSGTAVLLVWINWMNFYKRQYESVMSEDIDQHSKNQYSIHARYYLAIRDWSDKELQLKIDEFNKEYTKKWIQWVEKTTGVPVETCVKVKEDQYGNPIIGVDGKPEMVKVIGIKDLKYKGFKHKILMWRIKHHVYPQSGYKTSMELMSLFSYQDSNLNKRHLKADRFFYVRKSSTKLLSSLLIVTMGGGLIPQMVQGDWWTVALRLIIALGSLAGAILMGSINGVRGARIKLSVVEDACVDLEQWKGTKPVLGPCNINFEQESDITSEEVEEIPAVNEGFEKPITEEIFNTKMQIK